MKTVWTALFLLSLNLGMNHSANAQFVRGEKLMALSPAQKAQLLSIFIQHAQAQADELSQDDAAAWGLATRIFDEAKWFQLNPRDVWSSEKLLAKLPVVILAEKKSNLTTLVCFEKEKVKKSQFICEMDIHYTVEIFHEVDENNKIDESITWKYRFTFYLNSLDASIAKLVDSTIAIHEGPMGINLE